jgi:hypothetical protein
MFLDLTALNRTLHWLDKSPLHEIRIAGHIYAFCGAGGLHPVVFSLLELYYSGRQSQQSFDLFIPLTHYMFRPVRAIFRRILSFPMKLVMSK